MLVGDSSHCPGSIIHRLRRRGHSPITESVVLWFFPSRVWVLWCQIARRCTPISQRPPQKKSNSEVRVTMMRSSARSGQSQHVPVCVSVLMCMSPERKDRDEGARNSQRPGSQSDKTRGRWSITVGPSVLALKLNVPQTIFRRLEKYRDWGLSGKSQTPARANLPRSRGLHLAAVPVRADSLRHTAHTEA